MNNLLFGSLPQLFAKRKRSQKAPDVKVLDWKTEFHVLKYI